MKRKKKRVKSNILIVIDRTVKFLWLQNKVGNDFECLDVKRGSHNLIPACGFIAITQGFFLNPNPSPSDVPFVWLLYLFNDLDVIRI